LTISADVKTFFEKIGNFFKKLFSGNKNKQEATTEPPPTPPAQKDSDGVICIEYDETTVRDDSQTTTKAVQTISPSKNEIELKTTAITKVNEQNNNKANTFTTPNEQYETGKEQEPVLIGIDRNDKKIVDNERNSYKNDPTVVKAAQK